MPGIASFSEMASDEDDSLVTVVTCEGNLHDPDFPYKLSSLVARLRNLLPSGDKPFNVTNVEPWNSVRVTFNIPREAAQRLRQLAQQGDRALRDLGILSVQIEGDQVISLTVVGRFNEPQEIILRPSPSADDVRPIASTSSQLSELDVSSSVPNNVVTTRKNIAQYLSQHAGGLALGDVVSAASMVATTSPLSAATSTVVVPPVGDFKSPNVVAPGSEPIPFLPKGNPHTSPSRTTPNFGPFPFASMTHAMNTMHGLSSSSVSSSSASSSSSSASVTAIASSAASSSASPSVTSSRFPFSPPPPPYPGTSSTIVVPGTFQPVRNLVAQQSTVVNNLPKTKLSADRANATLASPLLVNLLQSDAGTSPPSQIVTQGFKGFPVPVTDPSTVIIPTKRKRKPRKSKEKLSPARSLESASCLSPSVSPASSPNLVATLGAATSADGCHFLQPFNIALPNLSPPPLTPPSSSSPPSLNAVQGYTSVEATCPSKPAMVASNLRIPALPPSSPQTAASCSSSSSAISNNSGQSSQETELSPWPSPAKRTQHLVNPFTGQLEPMYSDEDDDGNDTSNGRGTRSADKSATFVDTSGLFSEVGLNTDLNSAGARSGVPLGSTSSHASSSTSSNSTTSNSPSPPPTQPLTASLVSTAAAATVSSSSSLSEKIKLRLKLEPKLPKEKKEVRVDSGSCTALSLQYKVDVSFVNIPTSVAHTRRVSGGTSSSVTQIGSSISSVGGGASGSCSSSPVASPSAPEPRVPPLHISLKGRNATVVNPRREDRDSKSSTSTCVESETVKPQRSRSPRNSRLDGTKTSGNSKAQILLSGRRNAASRGGISMKRGRAAITSVYGPLLQDPLNVFREKALLSGGSMFVDSTTAESVTTTSTTILTSARVSETTMPSRTASDVIKGLNALPQTAVVSSVLIPKQLKSSVSKNPSPVSKRPHSFSGLSSSDNLAIVRRPQNTSKSDSENVDEEFDSKSEGASSSSGDTMQPEVVSTSPRSLSTDDLVVQTPVVKSSLIPTSISSEERSSVWSTAASPLIVRGVTVGAPCFGLYVSEVVREPISIISPQCQQEKLASTLTETKAEVEDAVSNNNDDVELAPPCSDGITVDVSSYVRPPRSDVLPTTITDDNAPCEPPNTSILPTTSLGPSSIEERNSVEEQVSTTVERPKSADERMESISLSENLVSVPRKSDEVDERTSVSASESVYSGEQEKCASPLHLIVEDNNINKTKVVATCACRESSPADLQKPEMSETSLVNFVCGVSLADIREEDVDCELPRKLNHSVENAGYSLVPTLNTTRAILNNVGVTSLSLNAVGDSKLDLPRLSKLSSLVASENLRIAAVVGASSISTGHHHHHHQILHQRRTVGCLSEDTEMEGDEADVLRLNSTANRSLITVVSASPSSASPSGSSPDSLHVGTSSEDNGDSGTGSRSHGFDNRVINQHRHHHSHHQNNNSNNNNNQQQHRGRRNSNNGSPYEDSGIDSMDAVIEKLSGGESPENDVHPLPPPPVARQDQSLEQESIYWRDNEPPSEVKSNDDQQASAETPCDAFKPSPDDTFAKDIETVSEEEIRPITDTDKSEEIRPIIDTDKSEEDRPAALLSKSDVAFLDATISTDEASPVTTAANNSDDAQFSDEDRIPHLESITEKDLQEGLEGSSNSTNKSGSNSPSPPSLEKIAPLPNCCLDTSPSDIEFVREERPMSSLHVEDSTNEDSKDPLSSFVFEESVVVTKASDNAVAVTDEDGSESTQLLVFTVQDVESIMVTDNEGLLEISDENGTKLDVSVLKDEHVSDLDETLDVYLDQHFVDNNDVNSDRMLPESGTRERKFYLIPVIPKLNNEKCDSLDLQEVAPSNSPAEVNSSDTAVNEDDAPSKEEGSEDETTKNAPPQDEPQEQHQQQSESQQELSIALEQRNEVACRETSTELFVNNDDDEFKIPDLHNEDAEQQTSQYNQRPTPVTDITENGGFSSAASSPTSASIASPDVDTIHTQMNSDPETRSTDYSSPPQTRPTLVANRTWLVPNIAPVTAYSPPPTLDAHGSNDDPPHLQSPFLDLAASANSCGDEDDEAEPFPRLSPAVDLDDTHLHRRHHHHAHVDDDDDYNTDRDDFDSSSCSSISHHRDFKEDMDDLYIGNTSITSGDHNYIVRSSSSMSNNRDRSRMKTSHYNKSLCTPCSSEVNNCSGSSEHDQLSIEIPSEAAMLTHGNTQENLITERRMTRSTRSSCSRLVVSENSITNVIVNQQQHHQEQQNQQQQRQTSPNDIANHQPNVQSPITVNSCDGDEENVVHESPSEQNSENDSCVVRTLPNRSAAKRKRCDDSSSESMDSTTTLNNDNSKQHQPHSGRSKSPLVVEMTAHFYSKPVKRKCSENAVELIKACIGVDDNPKRAVNSKHHLSNADTGKLLGGDALVMTAAPIKNAKSSKEDTVKGSKSESGQNSTPSCVIGSEESSDDEVSLSELATKTRSGRTGCVRNVKQVRQQPQQNHDETMTSKSDSKITNSKNSVTNNRKGGVTGRSGPTAGVSTSRPSRHVDRTRRTETPPLPNTRGHDRSPQRVSHRPRTTTKDYVATQTPHNQLSREDGVTTGRRKLRSSTSSVSGYYDSLPQKRRRMSRDNR